MAFTNDPVSKTQITKRFNFVGNQEQRDTNPNKDQRYVNFIPEQTKGPDKQNSQWWLRTRGGLQSIFTLPLGTPRGIYYWDVPATGVISVVDNSIYSNGTFVSTIATSTGKVGFTEFLSSTGIRTLVMVDGTNGYVFTANNAAPTLITSVDFPSPHIPNPIFMDGYLFLAKAGTQDVYNSNLDDPTLWAAGEYVSSEMFPDTIQGLSRNNNYIYAIGTNSVEFLYDAANATGSPLARHDSAVQQFGTPCRDSVLATDKEVIMVGQIGLGGLSVWTIDGFKEADIGIPALRFSLSAEGTAIANAIGYGLKIAGQKLYVLCLTSRTWVYSFESKLWFEWDFINRPLFSTDSNTGYPYVLLSGVVAKFTDESYTDLGQPIGVEIVTNKIDFDTIDRKRMDSIMLISDVPSVANQTIDVQWSDDDYQTWSTATTMILDTSRSVLYRLGIFRRRALRFTYNRPYTIRFEGMEITINKGST